MLTLKLRELQEQDFDLFGKARKCEGRFCPTLGSVLLPHLNRSKVAPPCSFFYVPFIIHNYYLELIP